MDLDDLRWWGWPHLCLLGILPSSHWGWRVCSGGGGGIKCVGLVSGEVRKGVGGGATSSPHRGGNSMGGLGGRLGLRRGCCCRVPVLIPVVVPLCRSTIMALVSHFYLTPALLFHFLRKVAFGGEIEAESESTLPRSSSFFSSFNPPFPRVAAHRTHASRLPCLLSNSDSDSIELEMISVDIFLFTHFPRFLGLMHC